MWVLGYHRDGTVTRGLIAVKLIFLQGQKEGGGSKQLLEPGEKEFFWVICFESRDLWLRNTTSYRFPGRKRAQGIIVLTTLSLPPSSITWQSSQLNTKLDSVWSNRYKLNWKPEGLETAHKSSRHALTGIISLILILALYYPHFTDG